MSDDDLANDLDQDRMTPETRPLWAAYGHGRDGENPARLGFVVGWLPLSGGSQVPVVAAEDATAGGYELPAPVFEFEVRIYFDERSARDDFQKRCR